MRTVLTIAVVAALVATATPAWAACGACGPKGAEHAMGIGVGHSELKDATKAGDQAAKQAKAALKGKKADVVLVFDCVKDQQAMLDAVAKHFDAKTIYGCSAYNAITQVSPSGTVGRSSIPVSAARRYSPVPPTRTGRRPVSRARSISTLASGAYLPALNS